MGQVMYSDNGDWGDEVEKTSKEHLVGLCQILVRSENAEDTYHLRMIIYGEMTGPGLRG